MVCKLYFNKAVILKKKKKKPKAGRNNMYSPLPLQSILLQ